MRKIVVFAFIAAAVLAALVTVMYVAVPLVCAKGDGEAVPVEPETTFGWVVLSWLIYAVAGLIASITKTPAESFDAIKFTRSFLIMLLTGLATLALRISPTNVETQFGGLITILATTIVNTAPGVALIYLFEKLYRFVTNLGTKIQAARSLSGPGSASPS
jgi:hypothetical protein